MTTAAAALSLHPVAAAALGEVAGGVLEGVGHRPDLAVVVAGGAHAASLGSIAEAVRSVLAPGCLLALGASGTLGAGVAASTVPSVALWAASNIDVAPLPTALLLGETPSDALPTSGTLLVAASAGSHLPRLIESLAATRPEVIVVGGLVAASGASTGRVGLDGATDDPIAGILLPPDAATAVTAGAVRPLGDPLVVTGASGPVVESLAGSPAADRLDEVVEALDSDDRQSLRRGLFLCRVVDERAAEPGPAEIVAHGVRGLVAGTRAVAVDARLEVGTLVRFGCLDPRTAEAELRRSLVDATTAGPASGALLFSCVARGAGLFPDEAHDAVVAAESLATSAVAGAFCVGEVGPRGRRSWLSGYTAAALVTHASGRRTLG